MSHNDNLLKHNSVHSWDSDWPSLRVTALTNITTNLLATQMCVTLLRQGRRAPHREARQKRRELRLRQQAEQEELELRMRELQIANEAKQMELEKMRKVRRGWSRKKKLTTCNCVTSQETPAVLILFCTEL